MKCNLGLLPFPVEIWSYLIEIKFQPQTSKGILDGENFYKELKKGY